MERTLISSLLEWKDKPDRKPLIIKGVRQSGKTYLMKDFGERHFQSVAYFNFEENDALKSIFDLNYDVKRILFELGLSRGSTITPGDTLLVFDEIQECGRAITSLKYFCENAPEYHVVCAGSLLGIALRQNTSFPVGKVDFLDLYPMSFSEFLLATGEDALCQYLNDFHKGDRLPAILADKLSGYLKQYYVTGGMPEAVKTWLDTHDIGKVETVQQSILSSYELDFAKHAPTKDFPKLTAVWRSIPEQLAKENTKFIFGHVKQGWRAKDLEDALEWLIGAGLVHKVEKVEKPGIPMSAYADPTFFKLYLSDVGLLRKLSKLPYEVVLDATPMYREFKGALTENFVLGELVKSVDESPYYWSSGNTAEVDFVVQCGTEIIPIEVKSERNVKARSLSEYRKKYLPVHAVKTSMKPDADGEDVLSIPLYLISSLRKYLP